MTDWLRASYFLRGRVLRVTKEFLMFLLPHDLLADPAFHKDGLPELADCIIQAAKEEDLIPPDSIAYGVRYDFDTDGVKIYFMSTQLAVVTEGATPEHEIIANKVQLDALGRRLTTLAQAMKKGQ